MDPSLDVLGARPPGANAPVSPSSLVASDRTPLLVALLAALACAWIVAGGASGLLYALLYAGATIPGLPLGFRLFGRQHPAGWIAGIVLGYAATAIALWIPIVAGIPSAPAFVVSWSVVAAASWIASRRMREPLVELPRWRAADSLGLAAVLLVTLALATPPLARVGESDAKGEHVYRAYFTADFVWHTALTAELAKFSMPPRNPYLASQPIHYYWTYFLLPATAAKVGPAGLGDVQMCLKVNALATGLALMSAVFLAAWAAIGRPLAVTAGVLLALVAASAEGSYEMYRLWSHGQSLRSLRDINIDAITAWHFQGLRLDGLPRCLWYVPQHSMGYALGLVALAAAAASGSMGSMSAILLCGLALGGATLMNPFVGGIFALAWGLAVSMDALRHSNPWLTIVRHTAAAVPVALAVLWCVAARMVDGAGDGLAFGFWGPSAHSTLVVLLLSLGPVLIPAIIGVVTRSSTPLTRIAPALALVVLSLLTMHLVRLRVDIAWVPFRAGQMLLVAVPALIARWLAALSDGRQRFATAAIIVAALVVGLPTTAIDAYNAQDVEDMDPGPGFHWTLVLQPDEERALEWIRTATPEHALVQMEPTIRDRDATPGGWGERWSLIPSFGERRMAAGLPISLMRIPEYAERSAQVKTIYETGNAQEAWTLAHRLHIAFLYVDSLDRTRYPGAAKFDASPQFFTPSFKSGDVAVYTVR